MSDRYILQPSSEEGWLVCTDRVNNIVCRFKEHKFNETQKFTLLDGDTFGTKEEAIKYATFVCEMGDWLRENHYKKIF